MGAKMSTRNGERSGAMEVKRSLSDDVRKITNAAARLRIHTRRKIHSEKKDKYPEKAFVKVVVKEDKSSKPQPDQPEQHTKTAPIKGLPQNIVAATRVTAERKWTLSDLLQSLGSYVQKHCVHLATAPTPSEVAMWVRCADRALQLNGWTINCFLMESHVVFTYMLLSQAFERFEMRSLADVKELVLMSLYVSYTYNANEISYPLRPFLVKQDKLAFWDKCTELSLGASSDMLRLNRERTYYSEKLASLKRVCSSFSS